MANLSITRRCRRGCSYCFAKHELARSRTVDMPPEVYEAALRFLQRSAIPEARLLGGEPTEHPRFIEYVNSALERGFRVVVFSGGLVPQPALDFMASLPTGPFMISLNSADPAHDEESLVSRQREICRALGRKVVLGVNLTSSEQDPVHLFDWIKEYDLLRRIRLGITQPIWGGRNESFELRSPGPIPLLERLVETGEANGVAVDFDCGFTPCMFSPRFVEAHPDLFAPRDRSSEPSAIRGRPIGMRCGAVLDVLPEGDCIACYALSRFRRLALPPKGVCTDVVSSFARELSSFLPVGIYPECLKCDYREKNLCGGGCRARRALQLGPDALARLGSEPGDSTPS